MYLALHPVSLPLEYCAMLCNSGLYLNKGKVVGSDIRTPNQATSLHGNKLFDHDAHHSWNSFHSRHELQFVHLKVVLYSTIYTLLLYCNLYALILQDKVVSILIFVASYTQQRVTSDWWEVPLIMRVV